MLSYDPRQYDFPLGLGESSHIRDDDPTGEDDSYATGVRRNYTPLAYGRELMRLFRQCDLHRTW
jgi:hypothetical protein